MFDDSPLAAYLEGMKPVPRAGVLNQITNISYLGEGGADSRDGLGGREEASSNSSSPSFAPRGRPIVQPKFRSKLPPPLQLAIPQNNAIAAIHSRCSVGILAPSPECSTDGYIYRKRLIRDLAAPITLGS